MTYGLDAVWIGKNLVSNHSRAGEKRYDLHMSRATSLC
jgi:hypothetical protein